MLGSIASKALSPRNDSIIAVAIRSWASGSAQLPGVLEPAATAAALAAGQLAVFDPGAALKHSGGDRRLLQEVVGLFRADYPGSLRQIASAIKAYDAERLRLSAHALKGALATVVEDPTSATVGTGSIVRS